jgi:hypothetical protein
MRFYMRQLVLFVGLNVVGTVLLMFFMNKTRTTLSFKTYDSFVCEDCYHVPANRRDEWDLEWIPISKSLFVRNSSIFYFPLEDKIRFMVITRVSNLRNMRLYLQVENRYDDSKMMFVELNYVLDKFIKDTFYGSFAINGELKLVDVLKIGRNLDCVYITLFIKDIRNEIETRKAINVTIREPKRWIKPKELVLCTKFFNLTHNDSDVFKTWLDVNKKSGYDKVIIYNNSISTEPYTEIVKSYNGFLEIRPYKFLTHLDIVRNISDVTDFDELHSLKYVDWEIRRMHERIALNDCFLSSIYYFKRVAIFDIDEIIYPSDTGYIGQETFVKDLAAHMKKQALAKKTGSVHENCNFDMASYLDKLKSDKIVPKKLNSYWFQYAHFMTPNETKLLFDHLRAKLTDIPDFKEPFTIDMKLVCDEIHAKNITFQVNSTKDHAYAKNLLDFYEKYIENNFFINKFNKKIDDIYNRLFMFVGKYFLEEGYGKSIHEAHSPFRIGHHESYDEQKRIELPFQSGYVSHFRKCLFQNDTDKLYNINQINLDFHFINCFD